MKDKIELEQCDKVGKHNWLWNNSYKEYHDRYIRQGKTPIGPLEWNISFKKTI